MNLREIQRRHEALKNGEEVEMRYGNKLDYGKLFNVIYDVPPGSELVTAADKERLKLIVEGMRQRSGFNGPDIDDIDISLLEINFGEKRYNRREFFRVADEAAKQDYRVERMFLFLRHSSAERAIKKIQRLLKKIYEEDKRLVLDKNTKRQELKKDAGAKNRVVDEALGVEVGYPDE